MSSQQNGEKRTLSEKESPRDRSVSRKIIRRDQEEAKERKKHSIDITISGTIANKATGADGPTVTGTIGTTMEATVEAHQAVATGDAENLCHAPAKILPTLRY